MKKILASLISILAFALIFIISGCSDDPEIKIAGTLVGMDGVTVQHVDLDVCVRLSEKKTGLLDEEHCSSGVTNEWGLMSFVIGLPGGVENAGGAKLVTARAYYKGETIEGRVSQHKTTYDDKGPRDGIWTVFIIFDQRHPQVGEPGAIVP